MNNVGNPDYTVGFIETPRIVTFLKVLAGTERMPESDVVQWLTPPGVPTQKGLNTLGLLAYSGVIEKNGSHFHISHTFQEKVENTGIERVLQDSVLESISHDDLQLFIKNGKCPDASTMVWNPSDISPFQVNLREFLLSLNVIYYRHGYIRSSGVFMKHLYRTGALAREDDEKILISKEDLLLTLELKQQKGEEAEACAIEYETRRLAQWKKIPKLISDENVAAGYDIESFEGIDSKSFDRHIEVKYYNNGHFYISRNELEVAKQLQERYWIYLVTIHEDGSYDVEELNDVYSQLSNIVEWNMRSEVFKMWRKK